MMAVPLPLRPVMIFQHDEPPILVASFLQNSAQRVEEPAMWRSTATTCTTSVSSVRFSFG